jgi:hypothetical protein
VSQTSSACGTGILRHSARQKERKPFLFCQELIRQAYYTTWHTKITITGIFILKTIKSNISHHIETTKASQSMYIHSSSCFATFSYHINDIFRYERCDPHMFRAGDLVEAQLSFVVIPVKGGRRKMLAVLRSLALIKGTNFKKVSTNHIDHSA